MNEMMNYNIEFIFKLHHIIFLIGNLVGILILLKKLIKSTI